MLHPCNDAFRAAGDARDKSLNRLEFRSGETGVCRVRDLPKGVVGPPTPVQILEFQLKWLPER